MAHSDWRPYRADDDSFELRLPPDLTLAPLAGQPPGQTYLYAGTPGNAGTFSLLRGPASAVDPATILSQERDRGAEVTVLADEAVERDGLPAHRLHFRSQETRLPELVEDPATGARSHRPGGPRV